MGQVPPVEKPRPVQIVESSVISRNTATSRHWTPSGRFAPSATDPKRTAEPDREAEGLLGSVHTNGENPPERLIRMADACSLPKSMRWAFLGAVARTAKLLR